MTEDSSQCETMGLQPIALPCSNPLDRYSPTNYFKRKLTTMEDEMDEEYSPKKMCIEMDTASNKRNNNNNNNKEEFGSEGEEEGESDRSKTPSPDPSHDSINSLSDEEMDNNKENNSHQFESIIAKSLLFPPGTTETQTATTDKTNSSMIVEPSGQQTKLSPKVIVEHQPLPSIYELQQNNTTSFGEDFDSGVSEESSEGDVEDDGDDDDDDELETDEDEDVPTPSPLFSSILRPEGSKSSEQASGTPVVMPGTKSLYNDRFWQQTSSFPSPVSPVPTTNNSTFQFLDQSTQRIECAENGKSYLQLGTVNHSHQLPVTPVIQPKPNMVYRRPIPPFRNPMIPPPMRPVCDHSNCLQKKSGLCYRNQRSRVMNLSLHKLHMARQNHEGCLRRSVLICNLLRHIEDESEKEIVQEQNRFEASSAHHSMEMEHYWPAPGPHHHQQHQHQQSPMQQSQQQQQQIQHQQHQHHQQQQQSSMPTSSQPNSIPQGTMTPSQYHLTTGPSPPSTPSSTYDSGYDMTPLKDFSSAFRSSTPFSVSSTDEMDTTSSSGSGISCLPEEEKGINWGSVLSLSSQPELDPLNNNSFSTEAWVNSLPSTTSSPVSSHQQQQIVTQAAVIASPASTTNVLSSSTSEMVVTSMDDIGWKLSADDVLRAFPNDENIFVGP